MMLSNLDTAKALSCSDRWVHQREERDSYRQGTLRSEAEFCRAPPLGTGLLRVNGRPRWDGHPGVHQEAGSGRQETRTDSIGL